MMFSPKQEMTSPQGEVLRIVRELEFDHHSTWVKRVFFFPPLRLIIEQSVVSCL